MVGVVLGILFSVSQNIVSADVKKILKEAVNDGKDEVEYEDGVLQIDEDLEYFKDGIYIQLYGEEGAMLEGRLPSSFNEVLEFQNKEVRLVTVADNKYYVYDRIIEFKKHDNVWIRGIISGTDAGTTIHTMIRLMTVILPLLVIFSIVTG